MVEQAEHLSFRFSPAGGRFHDFGSQRNVFLPEGCQWMLALHDQCRKHKLHGFVEAVRKHTSVFVSGFQSCNYALAPIEAVPALGQIETDVQTVLGGRDELDKLVRKVAGQPLDPGPAAIVEKDRAGRQVLYEGCEFPYLHGKPRALVLQRIHHPYGAHKRRQAGKHRAFVRKRHCGDNVCEAFVAQLLEGGLSLVEAAKSKNTDGNIEGQYQPKCHQELCLDCPGKLQCPRCSAVLYCRCRGAQSF
ncbi:MAG: hypothetical protein JJ864_14425 [Rhizobiaceae bacterium]|nr:hypothetical protein [Rhizobiaceae bacterium]